MSNGYAKLKLLDLQKNTKFQIQVLGGNPAKNDLQINPDDIRKGRKGFVANFLKLFEGKVTPKLEFSATPLSKIPKNTVKQISYLPNMVICQTMEIEILALFRQSMGYTAFRFSNSTDVSLQNTQFVRNFLRLLNISTIKTEFCDFFIENLSQKMEKMPFETQFTFFKLMMMKVYQMLDDPDFHFSKLFPTRDYHSDKFVQVKRVKLAKKCFNSIIKLFLKEVKIFEKKNFGVIKTQNLNVKFNGVLKEMNNLGINVDLKEKGGAGSKGVKVFDVMDLYLDNGGVQEVQDDGYGNCDFD